MFFRNKIEHCIVVERKCEMKNQSVLKFLYEFIVWSENKQCYVLLVAWLISFPIDI